MKFNSDYIYHIFNRGNNHQKIFFNERNYVFFLEKIKKQILPYADILCWCLMPNHFHLLINPKDEGCNENRKAGNLLVQELSYRIGILQSSYTQAINKQNHSSGSLFQQRAKSKLVNTENSAAGDYLINVFNYIHYNPLRAGLSSKLEDWPYSSFKEYFSNNEYGLCNKKLFYSFSGWDEDDFYGNSYAAAPHFR